MPRDRLRTLVSGTIMSSIRRQTERGGRRRQRPILPSLEGLEERSLLSVYMVTNLNDEIDVTPGDGSLRGEIDAAPSNAVVEFASDLAGGTINLVGSPIKLGHNITIEGPAGGVTINAGGQFGDLDVTAAATVSLSNLNFTGGVASGNGGGIVNSGNLTLTDCTISGNLAHGNGGGIDNEQGILSLTGCSLDSNQAYGNGGGLFNNDGAVTITSTSFSYGFIGGSGAGVENQAGKVTITGSSFLQNTDFANGGAIDNEAGGIVTISSSSLNNNSAADGGGIFNAAGATAVVNGASTQHNEANYGGDIDNAGTVTVTDLNAYESGAGTGGSIDNSGSLVLMDSSLVGNVATSGAGVANVDTGTAKLINSSLGFESAQGAGGAVYNSGGPLLLTNCTIVQSTSPTGPGIAVTASAGAVTLANTLVADNIAYPGGPESDVSGSIVADYSLLGSATGATFLAGSGHNVINVNPDILAAGKFGGPTETFALAPDSPAINAGSNALALDANGNPLTTDERGGVFNRISGGTVDIGAFEYETFHLVVSTTSDENDGNDSPGHLSFTEAIELASENFTGTNTITFDPTVFSSPQVITLDPTDCPLVLDASVPITGPAAGVTVIGSDNVRILDITGNILGSLAVAISNIAFTGGGIDNSGSGTLTLTDCAFIDDVNTTSTDTKGGGLENFGTLDATDCTFTGNTSVQGAGLFNNGIATLVRCSFTSNQAVDRNTSAGVGGAIDNEGELTATDTDFSGNTTTVSGGAIASPGTLNLTSCQLTDNRSESQGGAIDTEAGIDVSSYYPTIGYGTVTLTDCTLSGNSAGFGGAINAWSTVNVTDCALSDNTGIGGAIDNEGGGGIPEGDLVVTATTFTGNSSGYDGGAILDYGNVSVTDSTFAGNSAEGAGGAVVIHEGSTATLTDSTFSGNSAKVGGAFSNGGNFDVIGGYATLTQCTISGNSSSSGGGGVFSCIGYTTLTNTTVTGNQAPVGAGLDVTLYPGRIDPFSLANTIVAGNDDGSTPDDINGTVTANYDLIGAAGAATFASGSGNNLVGVTNPGLGTLGSYGGPTQTVPLLPGSPAIDAGSNALALQLNVDQADPTGTTGAVALTTDERRLARIVGGNVDIGADEYQSDLGVTLTSTPGTTYTGGSITDTVTVTNHGADASTPVLSDPVPAGTVLASWSTPASGWILTTPTSGGQVTATATLPAGTVLPAGASATFTLVLQVNAPFDAIVYDTATVGPVAHDTNLANNTSNTVANTVGLGVTSFGAVSPSPRNSPVSTFDVTFNGPVNLATFTDAALTLTGNSGPNLITSAVTVGLVAGTTSTYQISGLAGLTATNGDYTLTVNATGIQGTAGGLGQNTLATSWLMDTTPPTSTVSPLPARETSLVFPVSATGSDGGSPAAGIAYYNIFSSTNGKTWTFWTKLPASNPTASFTGRSNTTYAFYSIAYDAAGNAEIRQPAIEASTYVPDLTPPITSVDGSTGNNPSTVNVSTGTFTLNLTGSDPGGGLLTYFEVFVSIDSGAYQEVGPYAIPASPAGGSGTVVATVSYQGLTDGQAHTYSFYSIGVDSAGNVQSAPANANVTFSNQTFAAPASLQVTSFSVEHDSPSRSFVRFIDLGFNETDSQSGNALSAIVNSIGTSSPDIQIYKYDLNGDGSSKTPVSLSSPTTLAIIDHAIEIDFGASGIGGSASTTAADGYYEVDIKLPNGQTSLHHFYRLLGAVDGSGTVDQNDLNAIAASINETSPLGWTPLSADVNGAGTVSALDLTLATRSKGRKLAAGLTLG